MSRPDPPKTETCAYCGKPTYVGPCSEGDSVYLSCCVNCVDKFEPVPRSQCDTATLAKADAQAEWHRSEPFWHNMHSMGRRRRSGN